MQACLLLLVFASGVAVASPPRYENGACTGAAASGLAECGRASGTLREASLVGRTLQGIRWTHANVDGKLLERVRLDGAWLDDGDWRRSNLRETSFANANLRGSRWFETHCEACDWSGADARAVRLSGAVFVRSDFRQARLNGAFFLHARFVDCDFRGANLRETLWLGSRCERCRADASTFLPWPRSEAQARGFVFE